MATTLGPSIVRLLSETVYYGLLAFTVMLVLVVLGVPATFVLSVSTIILVLVGLALRESLANFAATVSFLVFQPFRRGAVIETMGRQGTAQEILLFNTMLLMADQRIVSLPNSKVQESDVINYTRMGCIRTEINLSVAYGEDLRQVRSVLLEIVGQHPAILSETPLKSRCSI